MLTTQFTPAGARAAAQRTSKRLAITLAIIGLTLLLVMVALVPFTEGSFEPIFSHILALVLGFLVYAAFVLAIVFVLYHFWVMQRSNFLLSIRYEFGDNYVTAHVDTSRLNLVNQFGYRRSQRKMIKEIYNRPVDFGELIRTDIRKHDLTFYKYELVFLRVPKEVENYPAILDFVKTNQARLNLSK